MGDGFRGATTNPPLSLQVIEADPGSGPSRSRESLRDAPDAMSRWFTGRSTSRSCAAAANPFPFLTGRTASMVSFGEVDPRFVTDGPRVFDQAMQLAALGTECHGQDPGLQGRVPGDREAHGVGHSTNNTTSFTLPQYIACMNAVSRGPSRARLNGVDLSRGVGDHHCRLAWATSAI